MRRKMEFHRRVEVFLQLQLTLEPEEIFTDNWDPHPNMAGREYSLVGEMSDSLTTSKFVCDISNRNGKRSTRVIFNQV